MRLTDGQISEFQKLYKNSFGIEISRDEAIAQGLDLINLVRAVYKPVKKLDFDDLKKANN